MSCKLVKNAVFLLPDKGKISFSGIGEIHLSYNSDENHVCLGGSYYANLKLDIPFTLEKYSMTSPTIRSKLGI